MATAETAAPQNSGVSSTKLAHQSLSRSEIRLIRLKPRSYQHPTIQPPENDLIVCEIETYSHSKTPPYIALSYAWGKSKEVKIAFVIGTGHLEISRNVEEALYHLRHGEEDLHIWIDQLCINQTDKIEKSHQVQRMRQIYNDAIRVIAWLGQPADNSDMLIEHIRSVAVLLATKDYPSIIKMHADIPFLQKISHAFRSFCQRPYWKRLWVIQEFSVAQEVVMMCGYASLMYMDLRQLLSFLLNMPLPWPEVEGMDSTAVLKTAVEIMRAYKSPANSFLEGIFTRRRRYQLRYAIAPVQPDNLSDRSRALLRQRETLFRVLVTSLVLEIDYNQPEATEPRDRIFSVMNFADDVAEFPGFPDYIRSCEDVYREVAQRIILQGNIDLLSFCQPPDGAHEPSLIASWAPDWRLMIKRPCTLPPWFSKFTASGDTHAEQMVKAPDARSIMLRGVLVDTVKDAGTVWDPDWLEPLDGKKSSDYIAEIERFCAISPRIPTISDANASIAAIRIAIADRYNYTSHETQPELLDGFKLAVTYLEESMKADWKDNEFGLHMPDTLRLHEPWYIFCMHHLHSRRPFISDSGYVGLAPMRVKPGDQIVIFLGGKTAYVVRETDKDVFEMIGESYVHGIMYGEFMNQQAVVVRTFLLR